MIGILTTAALADHIRGLRVSRETPREQTPIKALETRPLTVVKPREQPAVPTTTVKPRSSRGETKVQVPTDDPEDVIAALIAAGYKSQIAREATWACNGAERSTVEDWTRAALRRCSRSVS